MKKFLKLILVFLLTSIFAFSNFSSVSALAPKVDINTQSAIIGQFYYGNKTIYVRRITADKIPVFCMDINLDYPHGETFELLKKEIDPIVNNILTLSYPNADLAYLGITNNDDGYFITQTLLWCYLNDFDINRVYCDNDIIEKAIHKLYNNSHISIASYIGDYYILNTTDKNVQSVIFSLPINTDKVDEIIDNNEDSDIKDVIDNSNNNNIFLGK